MEVDGISVRRIEYTTTTGAPLGIRCNPVRLASVGDPWERNGERYTVVRTRFIGPCQKATCESIMPKTDRRVGGGHFAARALLHRPEPVHAVAEEAGRVLGVPAVRPGTEFGWRLARPNIAEL